MTRPEQTVVITGLGATTPLGGDVASTWAALLAGESGVSALETDWAADLPSRIAATLKVEPTEEQVPRVQARRMDRVSQIALVASLEAWPMPASASARTTRSTGTASRWPSAPASAG